jgi:ABC-type phosphate transport system substrate-binding protein
MRKSCLLAVFVVGPLMYFAQAKQMAVVTEKSNAMTNVSAAELSKLFLAKTRTWPDGKPVVVVVRDLTSPDMQLVLRRVFNMTPAEARSFVNSHHEGLIVADSDEAVIKYVSGTRGAIGIVDLFSLTKDVNVVKVDGKLPVEQGYFLKGD